MCTSMCTGMETKNRNARGGVCEKKMVWVSGKKYYAWGVCEKKYVCGHSEKNEDMCKEGNEKIKKIRS